MEMILDDWVRMSLERWDEGSLLKVFIMRKLQQPYKSSAQVFSSIVWLHQVMWYLGIRNCPAIDRHFLFRWATKKSSIRDNFISSPRIDTNTAQNPSYSNEFPWGPLIVFENRISIFQISHKWNDLWLKTQLDAFNPSSHSWSTNDQEWIHPTATSCVHLGRQQHGSESFLHAERESGQGSFIFITWRDVMSKFFRLSLLIVTYSLTLYADRQYSIGV